MAHSNSQQTGFAPLYSVVWLFLLFNASSKKVHFNVVWKVRQTRRYGKHLQYDKTSLWQTSLQHNPAIFDINDNYFVIYDAERWWTVYGFVILQRHAVVNQRGLSGNCIWSYGATFAGWPFYSATQCSHCKRCTNSNSIRLSVWSDLYPFLKAASFDTFCLVAPQP